MQAKIQAMQHGRWWRAVGVGALLAFLSGLCRGNEPVYPGTTWVKKAPSEAGMNARKLRAFASLVQGRGCVVRFGTLVYEWGDTARRGDVASAAKPFYAHFLFKAIENGKIPVPNSIPRAGRKAANMLPGQRSIGSRRIPDNQTDHMGSYSWLWWLNGVDRAGKRHWPDVPKDAYGAFGHGGPRAMVVVPSLKLIVSWNDAKVNSRAAENCALKLLVEAVDPGVDATASLTQGSVP